MTKQLKHFVLFSGGLDSAVVLWRVVDASMDRDDYVEAVSIDYGQRHAVEMKHAEQMAHLIDVPYTTLRIPDLLMGSMLTSDKAIPEQSYSDLPVGMSPTYVPFRNGLMISMLAAAAQKWVMEKADRHARIYIGSHAEDAENDAYPDCSVDFMSAMGKAVSIGTYGMVELVTPLIAMKKAEIIRYGAGVEVPFGMTWSCYKGENMHCGKCMTCQARRAGFKAAGIEDPTAYAA